MLEHTLLTQRGQTLEPELLKELQYDLAHDHQQGRAADIPGIGASGPGFGPDCIALQYPGITGSSARFGPDLIASSHPGIAGGGARLWSYLVPLQNPCVLGGSSRTGL